MSMCVSVCLCVRVCVCVCIVPPFHDNLLYAGNASLHSHSGQDNLSREQVSHTVLFNVSINIGVHQLLSIL